MIAERMRQKLRLPIIHLPTALYKEITAPEVGFEPTTLRLHSTPNFRSGVDYLINSCELSGARGSFIGKAPQLLVSARSCLLNAFQQASLRVAIPAFAGAGSPEFTRFFNHSHLWKLQRIQPDALPLSYSGINPSREGTVKVADTISICQQNRI